jgi:hypothetical protein
MYPTWAVFTGLKAGVTTSQSMVLKHINNPSAKVLILDEKPFGTHSGYRKSHSGLFFMPFAYDAREDTTQFVPTQETNRVSHGGDHARAVQ